MKKIINYTLLITAWLFLMFDICYGAFSNYNKKDLYKSIINDDTSFSDVLQIAADSANVYCLNSENEVMIWDVDGRYKGYIQTPYGNGACNIYIYRDILCVRHEGRGIENGNILLYDNLKYAGEIRFKDEGSLDTELSVIDYEDKVLLTKFVNEDDKVVSYKDGQLCFNGEETDQYERLTQHKVKISERIWFEVKGIFRQRLVTIDEKGNEKIIMKETLKDFLVHSDMKEVVLFLVMFINLYMLLGKKMIWQGKNVLIPKILSFRSRFIGRMNLDV